MTVREDMDLSSDDSTVVEPELFRPRRSEYCKNHFLIFIFIPLSGIDDKKADLTDLTCLNHQFSLLTPVGDHTGLGVDRFFA